MKEWKEGAREIIEGEERHKRLQMDREETEKGREGRRNEREYKERELGRSRKE